MKRLSFLALVPIMFALCAPSSAAEAQTEQHQSHHPAVAPAAPVATPAPDSKPLPGKADADMARMDDQMKAMGEMHARMMAAKTPAERNALMAEQMKLMQDGMDMMNSMSAGGMGDMHGGMQPGMQGDMAMHRQMMEKRMQMMQAMMQMMMDRLSATPAK